MINKIDQEKLIERIKKFENIIIAKHSSPDWDTQGSAYGLREIILDNFKNKNVFVVGEKLNLGIREEDETKLNQQIIFSALLISVDVANFDRVDFKFKNDVKEVFKIDHHLEVDDFGKNKLVDVSAIACAQVVTLWAYFNNLKISKKGATFLYYGLVTDSGRFIFEKTNVETFDAAKFLIESKIDIKEIYADLYLKKFELAKWHNKAFGLAQFTKNNSLAFIKIDEEYFNDLDLSEEEIKSALGVLSGIEEVKIWFLAYKNPKNNNVKVSIRSRDYNINSVAINYNGGGHKLASGAIVKDWKELELLIKDLEKLIR